MALLSKPGVVIGTLVAGVAIVFGIAGCGGGAGSGFQSSAGDNGTPLVGTWTRATLAVDGQLITCPNNLRVNNIVVDTCVASETATFTADGQYTMFFPALRFGHLYAEKGTYSIDGDTLTLTRVTTATDTAGAGVLLPADYVSNPKGPQVVPNALTISDNRKSFTIRPEAPSATDNYSVPESLDGSTVTSTFTKN